MTRHRDDPEPAPRRRALSALLHRLALLLTLAVGAGVLVYNAVSIVNGDGGLVGLPMFSDGSLFGPASFGPAPAQRG
jgi:hypothetical protein